MTTTITIETTTKERLGAHGNKDDTWDTVVLKVLDKAEGVKA